MAEPLGGLDKKHELSRDVIYRDVTPLGKRVITALRSQSAIYVIYSVLIIISFVFPGVFDLCLLFGVCYYPIPRAAKFDVPFRIRSTLNEMDEKDKDPTGKIQKARGIFFFGNRKSDNGEIWAANEDLRTHIFVIGTTGAGKTEGLVSFSYNTLLWGSGFTYVDGKGDVSLWAKVFSMLREKGREDDLFVINYMTGNADTTRKRVDKLSNTYNPCVSGNAESIIQLLVSLMDASGGGGDMWKGRAISFVSSYMPALVELRDKDRLLLHIGVIREYMPFPKYYELMQDPEISERAKSLMQAFLLDVPGYKADKALAQSATFNEQYGYQQMQFTRVLSSLADTYGHIYAVPQAEINLADITLNCRIFLCLLPALEKSRPELGNLGKIIVAGMKGMMGGQLGAKIQGYKRELLDTRVTNSPMPYMITFDEFGYFMPEDAALMWAQARSLGFSLLAAGQDLQAFYRTSKEETLAIVGSSMAKIFGKVEDPTDTYDLISKLAGEAYVSVADGFESKKDIGDSYRAGDTVRVEKVARVDLSDLKNQVEGEVHFMVKSDIIRARLFYAGPKLCDYYRANHFIRVLSPDEEEIAELQVDNSALLADINAGALNIQPQDDVSSIVSVMSNPAFAYYTKAKAGGEIGAMLAYQLIQSGSVNHQQDSVSDDDGSSAVRAELVMTPESTTSLTESSEQPDLVVTEDHSAVTNDEEFSGNDLLEPQKPQPTNTPSVAELATAASAIIAATLQQRQALGITANTKAQLIEIGGAMGGTEEQAIAAADAIVAVATDAVSYPPQDPPPTVGDPSPKERMDDVMSDLEMLLMGGDQN